MGLVLPARADERGAKQLGRAPVPLREREVQPAEEEQREEAACSRVG